MEDAILETENGIEVDITNFDNLSEEEQEDFIGAMLAFESGGFLGVGD